MSENQRSAQFLRFGPSFTFRGLNIGSLKNFLTLSIDGGFTRYWSNGNTYTHTYNDFYYNLVAVFNYKQFSLLGQFSKRANELMGETIYKARIRLPFWPLIPQAPAAGGRDDVPVHQQLQDG